MGQTFGSTDGLDENGKPLGQNATADQLGLTGGQLFARKAASGALQGAAQGMQQPQQQGGGSPFYVPMPQQQAPQFSAQRLPGQNPFY